MSRLIKAISELMQSPQGSPKRGRNPEPFSRSEFKKLIQQEFAPAKVTPGLEGGKEAGKGSGIPFGIWNPFWDPESPLGSP
uniref:Uncharacterized protein n=1 Tax=Catharus ustulatus TaxID=91951 RepID=A0A8C3UY83_CATUS